MKKLLLSVVLISGFLFASAQEMEILFQNTVVNNETITVYGDTTFNTIECLLKVRNNTSADLTNVYVRRITVAEVPGSINSFCFGICYPPFVDTSVMATSIAAGATDSSFVGDYYPEKLNGVTTITYEFFDNITLANRVAAQVTVNYLTSFISFPIIDGNTTEANNSTLVVFTSDNQTEYLEKQLKLVNNSPSRVEMYVRRIINSEVDGSENSFCFGSMCYPSFTDTSSLVNIIAAGAVDSSFKADYYPNGHPGPTSITYEFFTKTKGREDIRESVTVIFKMSGVGINENAMAIQRLYPNPAPAFVAVEYEIKPESGDVWAVIRNLSGQVAKRALIDSNSGKAVIDVTGLADGVYTFSLMEGNKIVSTRKLIVQH